MDIFTKHERIERTWKQTALDRGRTDCINLTHDLDTDFQTPASYGHGLLTRKVLQGQRSVAGHSVPKIERKQTVGQTDGGDCVTSLANVVSKYCESQAKSIGAV